VKIVCERSRHPSHRNGQLDRIPEPVLRESLGKGLLFKAHRARRYRRNQGPRHINRRAVIPANIDNGIKP
jgi:hypothetical protein